MRTGRREEVIKEEGRVTPRRTLPVLSLHLYLLWVEFYPSSAWCSFVVVVFLHIFRDVSWSLNMCF